MHLIFSGNQQCKLKCKHRRQSRVISDISFTHHSDTVRERKKSLRNTLQNWLTIKTGIKIQWKMYNTNTFRSRQQVEWLNCFPKLCFLWVCLFASFFSRLLAFKIDQRAEARHSLIDLVKVFWRHLDEYANAWEITVFVWESNVEWFDEL